MKSLLLVSLLGFARAAWADVPSSLAVQGRATTPLAALSGTATVQPAGLCNRGGQRPYCGQRDLQWGRGRGFSDKDKHRRIST